MDCILNALCLQDVVRITFKALHDVVRAQGEAIKMLEAALNKKAGKDDVETLTQIYKDNILCRLQKARFLLN